ncbi:DUF5133 domain-containing protein [Streptomyces sp. Li-HN-5-11]|uniref:DUF5133 domain-containing protein n=1 Tax=Streptomyces sp. Li-HN-5-11 TaxID=3075432 RepID=UPI0028AEF791|nr:DUF5133 domain-containing protein [Streptomyces sp. Li-HN-5-11]WNM32387.1 DUF5133 domain-containing protein [Streptomyces sp. Li-HN-5-11]WOP38855.1 DUF5133 domain-containing protein [Streptomyces sp. Li-HN-5-13]
MLVPDPKVVRTLLTRYASLKIAQAERERAETARELEDVSYTLCVMMGTTSVHDAIARADALLLASGRTADVTTDTDGDNELSLAV